MSDDKSDTNEELALDINENECRLVYIRRNGNYLYCTYKYKDEDAEGITNPETV